MSGRHRAKRRPSHVTPIVIVVCVGLGALSTFLVSRETPQQSTMTQVTPTNVVSQASSSDDDLLTPEPVARTTTTTIVLPPPPDPVPTNTPYSPPPPPLPAPVTHGVGWQAMWAVVHAAFPDASLMSGYRTTVCGQYHCIGLAIDISAPTAARMQEIDAWIAATYPESAQLIHAPGPFNLLDGLPFYYGEDTLNDHYDHVHWALTGSV